MKTIGAMYYDYFIISSLHSALNKATVRRSCRNALSCLEKDERAWL